MRKSLISLWIGITMLLSFPAPAAPANHVDMAGAILDFLSRTELCLNSCRDAASTQAAIPKLQELRQESIQLAETQRNLTEPTIQDYMAVQDKMEAFTTIWNAIRKHLERLEEEQLMTSELRQILHIAPPAPQN